MNTYKKRLIEDKLEQKLKTFGGILVQGARGVGKTTTAKRFAKSAVRLDTSEKLQELASIAPNEILSGDTPRLIDE
jgi:DNA polymerase III gamma/tau subunit